MIICFFNKQHGKVGTQNAPSFHANHVMSGFHNVICFLQRSPPVLTSKYVKFAPYSFFSGNTKYSWLYHPSGKCLLLDFMTANSWFSSYLSSYSEAPLQALLYPALNVGAPLDSVLGPLLPSPSPLAVSSLPIQGFSYCLLSITQNNTPGYTSFLILGTYTQPSAYSRLSSSSSFRTMSLHPQPQARNLEIILDSFLFPGPHITLPTLQSSLSDALLNLFLCISIATTLV